jgi:hypothetical protein
VGAPDPTLTGVSGMAAVAELVEQLGVVAVQDAAIGPIKARPRAWVRDSCWWGWPQHTWWDRITWWAGPAPR